MKRLLTIGSTLLTLVLAPRLEASDAQTSASVSGGAHRPPVAAADARYVGDVGFATTRTETGPVSLARGVALGVDEDGLSFSLSQAVGRGDSSIATNFTLSLDRDGDVSHSFGASLAAGPHEHSASAGGVATTQGHGTAASSAAARSDPYGIAEARTVSQHAPAKRVLRAGERVIVGRPGGFAGEAERRGLRSERARTEERRDARIIRRPH